MGEIFNILVLCLTVLSLPSCLCRQRNRKRRCIFILGTKKRFSYRFDVNFL